MDEIKAVIQKFKLSRHPEGGFFREVHRSRASVECPAQGGQRSAYTSIYYLLPGNDFSAWHRITADETWFFHSGCDVAIYFFTEDGKFNTQILGADAEHYQVTIFAHTWFAARPLDQSSYSLVSCVVAPGFEFRDFELGDRQQLMSLFGDNAQNIQAIRELSRISSNSNADPVQDEVSRAGGSPPPIESGC